MFYLVLPNIRSCHNVGAMFRTADAFGIDKLILSGYTAEPPKPQIDKVSLGAEKWVPWERQDDLISYLEELKKQGFEIISLEKTDGSTNIALHKRQTDIALVVGSEVEGVSNDILMISDEILHIPMIGKKESLNVSVAAGVAMYVLGSKI